MGPEPLRREVIPWPFALRAADSCRLTKTVSGETAYFNAQMDDDGNEIITLSAFGMVLSTGWSDARLVPYVYFVPPADGIQDLDFVAAAPTHSALALLSLIFASITLQRLEWMRGFRIYASSTHIEVSLSDKERLVRPVALATSD